MRPFETAAFDLLLPTPKRATRRRRACHCGKARTAIARGLGPKGLDPQFGAGLVDAYQTILSLEPATTGDHGQSRSGGEPVMA